MRPGAKKRRNCCRPKSVRNLAEMASTSRSRGVAIISYIGTRRRCAFKPRHGKYRRTRSNGPIERRAGKRRNAKRLPCYTVSVRTRTRLMSNRRPMARHFVPLALLIATHLPAQAPEAPAAKPPEPPPAPAAAAPHFVVRRYPRDKDIAVAIVANRSITLGELVDHIDSKHFPGFRDAMPRPEIQRMLQSDLIAPWVRQFADVQALRHSLGEQPVDEKKLTEAQSASLKASFQGWLDTYIANRRASGRSDELSQKLVNSLLAD